MFEDIHLVLVTLHGHHTNSSIYGAGQIELVTLSTIFNAK